MKKLFLFAAAVAVAASANAADLYLVGSGVNDGGSWALKQPDAKLTDKGNGVYEWSGTQLKSGFKINDGSWDGSVNIGGSDALIENGVAYTYFDDGSDIKLAGAKLVKNPKLVLDTNNKTITLTGEFTTPVVTTREFYIIGSNVNGKNWSLKQPDAKFEDKDNGIYEWTGEVLGTGFKINDGTWDGGSPNFGSSGGTVENGVPYHYYDNSGSGDIGLYECTEVKNPKVVLNINDETITVTGDFGGTIKWYLTGINGVFASDEGQDGAYELVPSEADEEVLVCDKFTVTVEEGELKVSSTGWATKYGINEATEETVFCDEITTLELEEVFGESGNVPYVLTPGDYKAVFNLGTLELSITSLSSGVAGIEAEEVAPVYYNLQGIRVNNPKNGVFVKVAGKKASKVVVND